MVWRGRLRLIEKATTLLGFMILAEELQILFVELSLNIRLDSVGFVHYTLTRILNQSHVSALMKWKFLMLGCKFSWFWHDLKRASCSGEVLFAFVNSPGCLGDFRWVHRTRLRRFAPSWIGRLTDAMVFLLVGAG
jgi:hypothetical protein